MIFEFELLDGSLAKKKFDAKKKLTFAPTLEITKLISLQI